jgi:branched-chain amino acid transport system permease protein
VIVFWLFLRITKTGIAMRSVIQNREVAMLVGIKIRNIYLITVGLGSALAGLAGIFLGSIYYVYPGSGFLPFTKAFIIMIFGGFGNIKGSIYAAYIVAGIELIASTFLGMFYSLPLLFGVLMFILVVKPTGLAGIKEE